MFYINLGCCQVLPKKKPPEGGFNKDKSLPMQRISFVLVSPGIPGKLSSLGTK